MSNTVDIKTIITAMKEYLPRVEEPEILGAYTLAEESHKGQKRKTGEWFIIHPLNVALNLTKLRMDQTTIIAGLLHDAVEDTRLTLPEINQRFGPEVRLLVDGVTKLSKIEYKSREEQQADNFRKMLVAMAKDIRVIVIKLADRLHNMETLDAQKEETRQRISHETLDIYSPIANRLGIFWMKAMLEDLAFKHLKPEQYNTLFNDVTKNVEEHEHFIKHVQDLLAAEFSKHNFQVTEVRGRLKHLYSIYKKMERRNTTLNELNDIIAFRVIVDSVASCYGALGLIHSLWKPIPGRFKDYVAMPKANMYQSLHTTVIGPRGIRMEIQIRTLEMHKVAEEGIAAHWAYKEDKSISKAHMENLKAKWLKTLLEWQQDLKNPSEFMDSIKADLYEKDIYVFTPRGDVIELPYGATPIDFAYAIHTKVGDHCVGAKINERIIPLKTHLKSGDTIEILTSPNQTPNKDWLNFVKTSKARTKIRAYIQSQERTKALKIGRELLEKELKKYSVKLDKLENEADFIKSLPNLKVTSSEQLYVLIGYGKKNLKDVITKLLPEETTGAIKEEEQKILETKKKPSRKSISNVKIQGINDIMVRFAKCCDPIPGDSIVGYITRGRGITIHTSSCPWALAADPERSVEVEWDLNTQITTHSVKIKVFCENKTGLLADITKAISGIGVNINQAHIQTTFDLKAVCYFDLGIKNIEQLGKVLSNIEKIGGVFSAERVKSA